MIIIEGCDNTGKTVLASKILKKFPQLVQNLDHYGVPNEKESYMNYLWKILSMDPRATANMLFDRFFISEMVYGPILRGGTKFSKWECKGLIRLLTIHDPLIIHCYADIDDIVATFDDRAQLDGVKDNLPAVITAYHTLLLSPEFVNFNQRWYNYREDRVEEVFDAIIHR